MPYGTLKIDTITFTDAGVDKSIAVSGLVQNPTFTGNVTATGTVSGATVRATTVSGVTVSGTTANFASGVYTTQISGAIVKVPAGTPGAPPFQVGTGASVAPGLYSPATDQLGISTGGAFRLVVDSTGRVGIGTSSPVADLHVTNAAGGRIRVGGAANAGVEFNGTDTRIDIPAANSLAVYTNNTERARIDSSGRLLVGTSVYVQTNTYSALNLLSIAGGSGLGPQFSTYSADAFAQGIDFSKSRSATIGTGAIVQSGDALGNLIFNGYDGAGYRQAVSISAVVDGTPGLNDMPGRLIFSTTADGASSPTEKMRIDNAGNITWNGAGIKLTTGRNIASTVDNSSFNILGGDITTNPGANIELYGGTHATFPNLMVLDANEHRFRTANGATERARIDSSGRLLVGTSSSITGLFSNAAAVQLNASFGTQALALTRFSANNFGADIDFLKSRNATVGAHTIVQSGDQIANLNFAGSDGTAFIAAAGISANIDGTPGLNDMPGRLVFSTTADGASTPTERMRIDSAGRVGIGSVDATVTLNITRNTTGGTTAYSCNTLSTIQSDVTSSAVGFNAAFNTAAAAFTLAEIRYFNAGQGTIGVGSAVTSQYGFLASANLTGATNNFGFFSNIPAATGRWNFYAGGTADSYFASNNFIFANGGTERARVDSSGRLLVGTSASVDTNLIQIFNNGIGITSYSADQYAYGNAVFTKSRGTTVNSKTIVSAGDELGGVYFRGADGANYLYGAFIKAEVDGAPGLNDMPGRLVFATTPDGTSNATEQWRISNSGTVIYNQPAPAAVDVTATLTVANLTAKIITSTTAAAVTMTLPTGTLMDGGFSGLYNNMAFEWTIINTGGTNAVTVQAGASHTLVGSGTVTANGSGRFLSRRTAATTWVTYRLAT